MINDDTLDAKTWPGWSCEQEFDGEFDNAARIRMIEGGKMLLPVLSRYKDHLNAGHILEIGPFFNPLMPHILHQQENVTYLENDSNVCQWLKSSYNSNVIHHNIDDIEEIIYKIKHRYNTVILSQVINYIKYNKLIQNITKMIENNALVFINNVIDYGIETFFSAHRPHNIEETLQPLINNNFKVIEYLNLPKPKPDMQHRIIIVAKYNLVKINP